jgi:hypothetical protein
MTSELLTPQSSAVHKFVFSDDTVTVTFTYNLDKEYSFLVNPDTATIDSIKSVIENAESKGKALAQLRKFNELIAI